MRFSATADEPGCWNWTLLPAGTLKLCQSIAARFDVWLIRVVVLFGREIVAWPAVT
jgi:hypothetical protein